MYPLPARTGIYPRFQLFPSYYLELFRWVWSSTRIEEEFVGNFRFHLLAGWLMILWVLYGWTMDGVFLPLLIRIIVTWLYPFPLWATEALKLMQSKAPLLLLSRAIRGLLWMDGRWCMRWPEKRFHSLRLNVVYLTLDSLSIEQQQQVRLYWSTRKPATSQRSKWGRRRRRPQASIVQRMEGEEVRRAACNAVLCTLWYIIIYWWRWGHEGDGRTRKGTLPVLWMEAAGLKFIQPSA